MEAGALHHLPLWFTYNQPAGWEDTSSFNILGET